MLVGAFKQPPPGKNKKLNQKEKLWQWNKEEQKTTMFYKWQAKSPKRVFLRNKILRNDWTLLTFKAFLVKIHNTASCNPPPLFKSELHKCRGHKRHQGDEAPFLKQHKPTECPLCWGGNPFSKPSVLCSCTKTPPRTNQNKPRDE